MLNIQYIQNEIRIEGFHSIYYFEHGKEFYHAPEQHNCWEMVFVDSGEIIAVTDGVGCPISESCAIFHEPNEPHTHISNGEESNNMFIISFVSDSPAMRFFKKKTFVLDNASKTLLKLFIQEAKNELGAIQGDFSKRTPLKFNYNSFGSTQLMASYFEEFLIKLIRLGGKKIQSTAETRQIAKNSTAELIETYLKKNLYKNITMADICKQFYLGKSQLSQIFKEHTGKSPMIYYADLKTEEAKKMLRDGKLSISEIAEILGFSCIHSFSRSFKNATGFSPMQYKKSVY